jgi:site-specific recombinase XerD
MKCSCPIWCDGDLRGERYGRSLKTNNWQRAIRLAEQLERPNAERSDLIPCEQQGCNVRVESGRCDKHRLAVPKAIEAYLKANPDISHGTLRNYKRTLTFLQAYLANSGIDNVHQIDRPIIDDFRHSRKIASSTWTKELEIVRSFFRYCAESEWINKSPAANVKMPKNIKPSDIEPYSQNEIIKILAACDLIGKRPYERLRARAMTLLLRYTALRIGDVALLAKDRIRAGEIYLRTLKNGKAVKLPVPAELQAALDATPEPLGTKGESKYFFWSGNGTERSMIRDATRTMAAVFRKSGVVRAHAHRFRHTLATEILENGGTFEDAAEVLGNSPNIIRKHYAKWSRGRQERISTLLNSIFATRPLHGQIDSATVTKQ